MPHMDEAAIRARLRRLIQERDLECERQIRVWAGKGEAKPCSACQQPIPTTVIEYEVDLGALLHRTVRDTARRSIAGVRDTANRIPLRRLVRT